MHDAQVYRAYLNDAERLREDGAVIRRVVLDHELKRESRCARALWGDHAVGGIAGGEQRSIAYGNA